MSTCYFVLQERFSTYYCKIKDKKLIKQTFYQFLLLILCSENAFSNGHRFPATLHSADKRRSLFPSHESLGQICARKMLSATGTVFLRRSTPQINDVLFFLHTSPWDKFVLGKCFQQRAPFSCKNYTQRIFRKI